MLQKTNYNEHKGKPVPQLKVPIWDILVAALYCSSANNKAAKYEHVTYYQDIWQPCGVDGKERGWEKDRGRRKKMEITCKLDQHVPTCFDKNEQAIKDTLWLLSQAAEESPPPQNNNHKGIDTVLLIPTIYLIFATWKLYNPT